MDFIRSMVQGITWKARMENDAVFEYWTPFTLKRKEAVQSLLDIANGDYNVYTQRDIVSVWKTAG